MAQVHPGAPHRSLALIRRQLSDLVRHLHQVIDRELL
jgi:hypothetical protein